MGYNLFMPERLPKNGEPAETFFDEFARKFKGGDLTSMEDACALYMNQIHPIIGRYVTALDFPELAEEIASDVLSRVFETEQKYPGSVMTDNPRSYLFQIANHLVADHKRGGKNITDLTDEIEAITPDKGHSPESIAVLNERNHGSGSSFQ
jgi:DNA-directed RNA polymerase specialized sigma24 family protein